MLVVFRAFVNEFIKIMSLERFEKIILDFLHVEAAVVVVYFAFGLETEHNLFQFFIFDENVLGVQFFEMG